MKIKNKVLITAALLLLPILGKAESHWGAATNGLQLGVEVITSRAMGREMEPLCIMYMKNTSVALMYLRFQPPKNIQVNLLGPNNQKVSVKSEMWITTTLGRR